MKTGRYLQHSKLISLIGFIFNFNVLIDGSPLSLFRLNNCNIGPIMNALVCSLPSDAIERIRYASSPVPIICVVLRRLSFLTRWSYMQLIFGWRG